MLIKEILAQNGHNSHKGGEKYPTNQNAFACILSGQNCSNYGFLTMGQYIGNIPLGRFRGTLFQMGCWTTIWISGQKFVGEGLTCFASSPKLFVETQDGGFQGWLNAGFPQFWQGQKHQQNSTTSQLFQPVLCCFCIFFEFFPCAAKPPKKPPKLHANK